MAKKKIEQESKSKISVGIYEDEFETVAEKLKLDEVTPKTIRLALGLTETKSRTGYASKIKELIKGKSKEEQKELYEKLVSEE